MIAIVLARCSSRFEASLACGTAAIGLEKPSGIKVLMHESNTDFFMMNDRLIEHPRDDKEDRKPFPGYRITRNQGNEGNKIETLYRVEQSRFLTI